MTAADSLIFGALTLLGVLLSASFSGLETGLYTINRVRLTVRAGHGLRSAVRLRAILANPGRMLATILVGNNIANYMSSYGIAAVLDRLGYGPAEAVAINAAVLIPLLFVFGEILPKDLFRTHTDRWSYACSGFLVLVQRLLTWTGLVPLVQWFGSTVSRLLGGPSGAEVTARQRMSLLVKEGMGAGVLTEMQTTLVDRALALRDRTVISEMIPFRQVATVPVNAGGRQLEQRLRAVSYTRLPVVDGQQRVVGILSVIDALLEPQRSVAELMGPPVTVPASMPVREALHRLRQEGTPMALVTDRDRPLGVVTIKDLVEPLTGELEVW
jgi:CBS domain containing-hemolysin-like protein